MYPGTSTAGTFRPHYVTWSEQQKIEFAAPEYLRNAIRIVTETGLRIYKKLTPMKKDQLDLAGRVQTRRQFAFFTVLTWYGAVI